MSVKDMTDQQLNRALAEFMGYRLQTLDIDTIYYSVVNPHGFPGPYRYTADDAFLCTIPDYSTDPVASLEVQAAAIELDRAAYVNNLYEACYEFKRVKDSVWDEINIAFLLNASPRQRAEAAYMTLHLLREDI